MAATGELTQTRAPATWKAWNWRLGPKMMIAFLVVTLIPLALTGYVSVTSARLALLQQGTVNLTSLSKKTALEIDQYLSERRDDIVTLSQMPDIQTYATSPDKSTAQTLALKAVTAMVKRADYDSLAIINRDGVVILSSADQEVNANVKSEPYFKEALAGPSYISNVSYSDLSGRPSIYFSSPVRDAVNNVVGVIRSRINLYAIWRFVERDAGEAGQGTIGMLLDENGIRIAHSASFKNRDGIQDSLIYRSVVPLPDAVRTQYIAENRFGPNTKDRLQIVSLPEVAEALKNPQQKTTFESSADNSSVRHEAAIAALDNKPWVYVMMTPIPTFTSEADSLATRFAAITLIVAGFAALVGLLFARAITNPIVQLTHVAERVSLGELDVQISIRRKDEIGDLADALGRMQASLQAAIERLRARRPG